MFDDSKKYFASVVDNNDPLQLGRVQINITHLMSGWQPSLLPWAFPYSSLGGSSLLFGSSFIPEISSNVWVWFEDDENLLNPFYVSGPTLESLSAHTVYSTSVAAQMIELSSTYPDVKFIYFKNGICVGASSGATPELFAFHPTGAYLNIDATGNVKIKTLQKVTIDSSMKVEITSPTGGVDITGDVSVTGKVTATQNVESAMEVVAMNASTMIHLSTHMHTSGAPGITTTPPTPGT